MSRKNLPKYIRNVLPKACVNCGSTVGIMYHHIVPLSLGGNDIPSNIAVLCSACHDRIHFGKSNTIDHGTLIREGIKKAKSDGRKFGKKPADYASVIQMIAQHSTMFENGDWTETEIQEASNVQNTCYYKIRKMLLDEINSGQWNHSFPKPKRVRNMPLHGATILRLRKEREDVAHYRLEAWA